MKPIIGISANETGDSGETMHHLPLDYLPTGYAKGIQEAGGLPFLIPVGKTEDVVQYVSLIDKLILTGGQNVDPIFYGEPQTFGDELKMTRRDEFEMALFNEAIRQGKPVFGVCRGLQLMNVSRGGTLYQDLSQRHPEPVAHMQDPIPRQEPSHRVQLVAGSVLSEIYGEKTGVNSFHFQSIKDVASDFKVTAISEDGIVEGIEALDPANRWLAVQWHPDFAYEELEQEKQMFHYVVHRL